MNFSEDLFNGLLGALGQDVTWARASFCPCRNPASGQARVGCPICLGKGVFWADAVPAYAGLSSMRVQRAWESFGMYAGGDVVVTVPSDTPLYAAGESDRVVMVNSSESIDLPLIRGDEYIIKRGIIPDRAFWLTPDGTGIIDGDLPTVCDDGTVTWPEGTLQPEPGQQYTLQGRASPEYFMFRDLAQDRAHSGGLGLPRRLVLRKFDLLGR